MHKILFVTGNEQKFRLAQHVCDQFGFEIEQETSLDIPEIQDETGELIAKNKANAAFSQLQRPIVVTDDTWMIPGLKGFPGPYMKSMNHWFTAKDWLNLTRSLEDRTVILRQILVYQDEMEQVLFSVDIEGVLLTEARGTFSSAPSQELVSFDNGKHSIAEIFAAGKSSISERRTSWHKFAEWLAKKEAV